MKMINVMQRLADLDAVNSNVVNETNKSKKEKTSPIQSGQRKEKTMENLNLESLRYLAGVKDTIAECGMMGGSGSPASINISAGSGQELTGMLKDIMNLAGVSKVEPHHMPVDSPDAGPSTVISAPPMAGASGNKMDPNVEMHKLMAIVDGPDQDQDSMNSGDSDGEGDEKKMGEANNRMYDSSPQEKEMGDPLAQFGDKPSGDRRPRQAGLPSANPMETTFKQLMADYEQFIAEGVTTTQPKGPKEVDVPAVLRKQKRPGQATAQASVDAKNAKAGANVWSSKRTSEGAVKKLDADIKDKTMSDADFKKKYGMSKAEARKEMSAKKEKPVHNKMDEERTMSRAAKGHEKYGKAGMQALAKAGRDGKDLDKVRDKYNKYDEATAPKNFPKKGEKVGKEGNAFGKAVRDAKASGATTMKVGGKTMPVKK
jgi:hypothetical protein